VTGLNHDNLDLTDLFMKSRYNCFGCDPFRFCTQYNRRAVGVRAAYKNNVMTHLPEHQHVYIRRYVSSEVPYMTLAVDLGQCRGYQNGLIYRYIHFFLVIVSILIFLHLPILAIFQTTELGLIDFTSSQQLPAKYHHMF
jgi:hypothetical protein